MPQLHVSAKHVKRVDTRYVVGRKFKHNNLVSTLAFPPDPSEYSEDLVWKEDTAGLMRRQTGIAGMDGMYPEVSWRSAGTLEWNIELYMWLVRIGNIEQKTADSVWNYRRRSLKWAHFKARIEREIRASLILRDAAILTKGQTLGAGSRFDDISSLTSDPIAVFQLGAERVFRNSGERVNQILVPAPIHRKLTQHERIMNYAVNKLNMSKDRPITGNIIEQLIGVDEANPGNGLIMPGSYKVVDSIFNNTVDGPNATEQVTNVYPLGPTVVMLATGSPGGEDGDDNSFGFGKYLSMLEKSGMDTADVQIAAGNEGIGVFEFPDTDLPGGGTKTQLIDAWAAFVQNPDAAWRISGAADSTNTAEYESSLAFTG